ncbi:MAG: hypothetical protein WCE38_05190 [Burkholderiales bacterium]
MKSVAQLLKVKGTRVHSIAPGGSVLQRLKPFADEKLEKVLN